MLLGDIFHGEKRRLPDRDHAVDVIGTCDSAHGSGGENKL